MRAVDTNILARFYLRDDEVQGRIAAQLLAVGDVFIPKTVILELEWVLRCIAGQPGGAVMVSRSADRGGVGHDHCGDETGRMSWSIHADTQSGKRRRPAMY